MRIYFGSCKNLEEFRGNCEKFQEAISKHEVVVAFTQNQRAFETESPSSPSLAGRIQKPMEGSLMLKAWDQFLRLNADYANALPLETLAIGLEMPIEVGIKRVFSEEEKKTLLIRLKSPGRVSLRTSEWASSQIFLTAHLAFLPDFFHGASHFDSAVELEIDKEIAELFLDYQYGLPLPVLSLTQLIKLHKFAEYVMADELYQDTLNALMDNINDSNRDLILLNSFSAILNRDDLEVIPTLLPKFIQEIEKANIPLKKALFKQLEQSAIKNPFLMDLLGLFYEKGIGTTPSVSRAEECYKSAAKHGFGVVQGDKKSGALYGLNKELKRILERGNTPYTSTIQNFYKKLSKASAEEKKVVRETLEAFKSPTKEIEAATYFHLAIFYQEGIGTERNEKTALQFLTQASDLGHFQAYEYIKNYSLKNTILELNNIDADFYTSESSLEDLFNDLIPTPPLHGIKDFYKKLGLANRKEQQKFRGNLGYLVLNSFDPAVTPAAKYHLARFYLEGIGGLKKDRKALELLKEAAADHFAPAEKLLQKVDRAIAKKPQERVQENFANVRKYPFSTAILTIQQGLAVETMVIPRTFLPKHPDFKEDSTVIHNLDEEVRSIFLDFQFGLGIPADLPFEQLVGLYHLAYKYAIIDLLKATSKLIEQSLEPNNIDQLLPQLFDLVLLEEKPDLLTDSIFFVFLDKLRLANVQNQEAFITKLTPLVKEKNPVAQNLFGYCLSKGLGVKLNIERAIKYYELARHQFNGVATYNLGKYYHSEGLLDKASLYYEWATNQNLAKAQTELGFFLLEGLGGRVQNEEAGFAHIQEAADKGEPEAQMIAARCYYEGLGIEADLEKSFYYYKLAADQGFIPALANVAFCYQNGEGVAQDEFAAFSYYKEGADKEYTDCIQGLGNCYLNAYGTERNEEKAFIYFKMAADRGHETALHNLALCYENGYGVNTNLPLAFHYYKLAADNGTPESQYQVGQFFEEGTGTEVNIEEAMRYYQLAAEQGQELAQEALERLEERL